MRINCACEGNRKRAKDGSRRGAWMKRGRDVREGMRDVSHSTQGFVHVVTGSVSHKGKKHKQCTGK